MTEQNLPPRLMQAHMACAVGIEAEEAGDLHKATQAYMLTLRLDPGHIRAIERLGHIRFVTPSQPILNELRNKTPGVPGIVTVRVRNPCNFRCFYCAAIGKNNEPVERFDLDAMKDQLENIKAFYDRKNVPFMVFDLECGGGEPTVHPQFKQLIELLTNYGAVSFPSNNSQDPKRWLCHERAHRVLVISCLHPEAEANIERYLGNARYLLDQGCWFQGQYIAHPARIDKIPHYKKLFREAGIPLAMTNYLGDYNGKPYPYSYTEAEIEHIGFSASDNWWFQQISSYANRIRNFKGIPCLAGNRNIYLYRDGSISRCIYDAKRLDTPNEQPEPCRVKHCGCDLFLEKLNRIDTVDYYLYHEPIARGEKTAPAEERCGWPEHLCFPIADEQKAMYDALMKAYGKDQFVE